MECRTGKVCHLTWDSAARAVKKFKLWCKKSYREQGRSPRPYRCQLCHSWHVGNGSDKQHQLYLTARKLKRPEIRLTNFMTPEQVREQLDRLTPESRDELLREFVEFCVAAGTPHIRFVAIEVREVFMIEAKVKARDLLSSAGWVVDPNDRRRWLDPEKGEWLDQSRAIEIFYQREDYKVLQEQANNNRLAQSEL